MSVDAVVSGAARDHLANVLGKQEIPSIAARFLRDGAVSGMEDVLAGDARKRLMEVRFLENAEVDIVFDPPWTFDMLSDKARLELGLP